MRWMAVGAVILFVTSIGLPPVASQPAAAEFVVEDNLGDVRPAVGGEEPPTPAAASAPHTDMIDITSLRLIQEDDVILNIELNVVDLTPILYPADAGMNYVHAVRFQVAGIPVTYTVGFAILGGQYANLAGGPDAQPRPIGDLVFCVGAADSDGATEAESCPAPQRARGWIDFAGDRFLFEIPKLSILGENPPLRDVAVGSETPDQLPIGTELTGWHAISAKEPLTNLLIPPEDQVVVQDQVPDDGPSTESYALTRPAANSVMILRGPGSDSTQSLGATTGAHDATATVDQLTIAPGKSSRLPLTVFNDGASKRIVNLSVAFDEDDDRWEAQIVPTIEVSSGSSQTVNLFVRPGPGFVHQGEGVAYIRAASVGHADEVGAVRVPLTASVPPSVESSVLYPHVSATGVRGTFDGNRACAGAIEGVYPACNDAYSFWMNTQPDDPDADRDDEVPLSQFYPLFADGTRLMQAVFEMDAGLVFPIAMDTTKPVGVELTFSARVELAATVTAQLGLTTDATCDGSCADFVGIGSAAQDATIGTSPTTVELRPLLNPDFKRITSDDGRLVLVVLVDTEDEAATLSALEDAKFHAEQSAVRLPIIQDELGSGGPTFIGLHPVGDTEEFLNPGKTNLFEVILANEGVEDKRIGVEATIHQETWDVELRPADRYALAPGETARLALLVTAASDAEEGDAAAITIDAFNVDQPEDRGRLVLHAVATAGVDIADEADDYEPDPDTLEKVYVEEGEDSPFLTAGWLLAALVVVSGFRWRRDRLDGR